MIWTETHDRRRRRAALGRLTPIDFEAIHSVAHPRPEHHPPRVLTKAWAVPKWQDNHKACESVLSNVEWATWDPGLQLAKAVLLDDYLLAAELMVAAGQFEQVQRSAFDHWPLFRESRKTAALADAYRDLSRRPSFQP